LLKYKWFKKIKLLFFTLPSGILPIYFLNCWVQIPLSCLFHLFLFLIVLLAHALFDQQSSPILSNLSSHIFRIAWSIGLLEKLAAARTVTKIYVVYALYCSHESPIERNLRQMKLVHSFANYFHKVHFNIHFPPTPKSSVLSVSFGLSDQILYEFHRSSIRASRPVHLILLDFIILILFLCHI
jgi:hypothetical protein